MAVLKDEVLTDTVTSWLEAFEAALLGGDVGSIEGLFVADSHWRDLLAFSWTIQTVSGADELSAALVDFSQATQAHGFEVDGARTAPRLVTRAEIEVIEAIFRFETASGSGNGLLRLVPGNNSGGPHKAWTLMTALNQLKGFEESIGEFRPSGEIYSRDFSGPNWSDIRHTKVGFVDRDPTVLVVGGGQAGLSIAARLGQLGVDALIVDRWSRIGDNWRRRYHALTLHNQVHVNHLPYLEFPPTWPRYIPKDKVANWFESYVESMELNFWTETEFSGGIYDEVSGTWSVELERGGGERRIVKPQHIVMATGVSGVPNLPNIPSLKDFVGTVQHSSDYDAAPTWMGKKALVIGSGTSGHDIAQDLYSHGVEATLVQRSSTLIVGVEPSAQLPYALYDEGPPLEDCDLIVTGTPFDLLKRTHQLITDRSRELDKDLLDRLFKVGFKMDFGPEGTGWQFKYLERGGGYYFNVGCSDLIADGEIGLLQYDNIDRFVAEGAQLRNGEVVPADLVVLATGYKGQEVLVRQLFGETVAERVGPIWGFDPQLQELRNMWVRTGQPGLWFIAGSFAQCRIYSKFLAFQIKAIEEGLIA